MRFRRRGRLSPREHAEKINAAHAFVASMCPDPQRAAEYREKFIRELPPKRDRVRRPVDGKPATPLEKDILADILQALRRDSRVGFVWRQSSGVFQDGDRYIRTGPKGMPDIIGLLAGSGRAFFCEVKRPGLKPDEHQERRLEHFRRMGAIAGYATSADEALALLR